MGWLKTDPFLKKGPLPKTGIMQLLRAFTRKKENPHGVGDPDFRKLAAETNFNERELRRLFIRFCSLCHPQTGLIEKISFVQQPEVMLCPLIAIAYENQLKKFQHTSQFGKEAIKSEAPESSPPVGLNFDHFVKVLSVLSPLEPVKSKIHCKIPRLSTEHIVYVVHRSL
jgi:hypothetical protein